MSTHLVTVATLALAILFSPETLVLGLIIAGDRRNPRLAASAFAVGGIVGIAFATGIGLLVAHLAGTGTDAGHAHHNTWAGFAVRVAIAAALLYIGLGRAVNAARHQPIAEPDVSGADQSPKKPRSPRRRPRKKAGQDTGDSGDAGASKEAADASKQSGDSKGESRKKLPEKKQKDAGDSGDDGTKGSGSSSGRKGSRSRGKLVRLKIGGRQRVIRKMPAKKIRKIN